MNDPLSSVNFEHISAFQPPYRLNIFAVLFKINNVNKKNTVDVVLVSFLLTLNIFHFLL